MTQNRFKSWALWLSVIGAAWIIVTNVLGYEPISSEVFNNILNALGSILIAFGILNNPTNSTGF